MFYGLSKLLKKYYLNNYFIEDLLIVAIPIIIIQLQYQLFFLIVFGLKQIKE